MIRKRLFLVSRHIPVILVDDGSYLKTKAALAKIEKKYPDDVTLLTLPENRGKGSAVLTGMEMAANQGLTHVIQVDADGQHDLGSVEPFLKLSAQVPEALICGCPQYDDTVPESRLKGRRLTTGMVAIETLSKDIKDAMCGFRVYPVAPVLCIKNKIGSLRMGFDIEILVRLHWAGVPVVSQPVKVTYPEGGLSNFRMVQDNIDISALHTRLFLGMLIRLPRLLAKRKAHGR